MSIAWRRRLAWASVPFAVSTALFGCTSPSTPSVTAQPGVTAASTVTVTPSPTPGGGVSPRATPGVPTAPEQLRQVDPEQFRTGQGSGGYYFISPSANLSCGYVEVTDGLLIGCQAWSLVDNLPQCDDPTGVSSPAIDFIQGRRASGFCLSEGAFAAMDARVLEYGEQFTVNEVTCTSRSSGVTCVDASSGYGFTAAKAGFLPVG